MIDERLPGAAFLAERGLGLVGVLDCESLPATVRDSLESTIDLGGWSRLVVFANTGSRLWQAMDSNTRTAPDPIDCYSKQLAAGYATRYLGGEEFALLYPGQRHLLPLQQVGRSLGWGEPSPMGIGIHPQFGLWWAYRCAFLTSASLPVTEYTPGVHACDDCATAPCEAACPARAVTRGKAFAIDRCFRHRDSEDSQCLSCCVARSACPVGRDFHYNDAMLGHIYRTSMSTVRRYRRREQV